MITPDQLDPKLSQESEEIDEKVKKILEELGPWINIYLFYHGMQLNDIDMIPKSELGSFDTEVIITVRAETMGYLNS